MKKTVYVIGAGFSVGLGFPLTNGMLDYIWDGLDNPTKKLLPKIIEFHNGTFNRNDLLSHPNIEDLLTQIDTNIALFEHTRQEEGTFTKSEVEAVKNNILNTIVTKFHIQAEDVFGDLSSKFQWLSAFKKLVQEQKATIISFNYDLIIEQLLFDNDLSASHYGFGKGSREQIRILKPHGSLNWHAQTQDDKATSETGKIEENLRERLEDGVDNQVVYLFKKYRSPISKKPTRLYIPYIIPPTFLKNFEAPIYKKTMQQCVDVLGQANEIVFIGYSLPTSDFYAKFMLRCGFHSQEDGVIVSPKKRSAPTGASKVIVVNPSRDAAVNIKQTINPNTEFEWVASTASDWMVKQG